MTPSDARPTPEWSSQACNGWSNRLGEGTSDGKFGDVPVVISVNLRRNPLEHRAAIEAVHRQGHEVVLIADSVPKNLPSTVVAAHQVDLSDERAVDEICAMYEVAGVVTWSDNGVETASRIAARLGLPGVPVEAARKARNKFLMRSALVDRPDLIPQFASVLTWEDAEEAAKKIGFPAVLKPVAGSGSKGIFLLDDESGLRPAFDELTRITGSFAEPALVFEEMMTGTEHSVEGVVHRGQVHIAGVTDKRTTEPFRLELAHVHPSALPAETLAEIDALTRAVVTMLGFDDCAFHLECMCGPDSVKLVEVAARPGGDFIASHLVGLASGVPLYDNVVRVATGQAPITATAPPMHAGIHKIIADEPGTLVRIDGLDRAVAVPGVQHAVVDRAPGAAIKLPPQHFSSSVVGALIATGTSATAVSETLEAAVAEVEVVLS